MNVLEQHYFSNIPLCYFLGFFCMKTHSLNHQLTPELKCIIFLVLTKYITT